MTTTEIPGWLAELAISMGIAGGYQVVVTPSSIQLRPSAESGEFPTDGWIDLLEHARGGSPVLRPVPDEPDPPVEPPAPLTAVDDTPEPDPGEVPAAQSVPDRDAAGDCEPRPSTSAPFEWPDRLEAPQSRRLFDLIPWLLSVAGRPLTLTELHTGLSRLPGVEVTMDRLRNTTIGPGFRCDGRRWVLTGSRGGLAG